MDQSGYFFPIMGYGYNSSRKHEIDDYLMEVDSGAGEWKRIKGDNNNCIYEIPPLCYQKTFDIPMFSWLWDVEPTTIIP